MTDPAGNAVPQHPRPTPHFLPERPLPAIDGSPDWLRRADEPHQRYGTDSRRTRSPSPHLRKARKRRKANPDLWLVMAAILSLGAIAGAGFYYAAATGHNAPGTAQLAQLLDRLNTLWPAAGEPREPTLAAPGNKPVITAPIDVADASGQVMEQISLKVGARSDQPPDNGAAVLTQGLEAMLAGNVKAARALFRQALELGDKRAVAHLARSYDPLALARAKLPTATADPEKAVGWYWRAIEAGDESVKADMAALEQQRQD